MNKQMIANVAVLLCAGSMVAGAATIANWRFEEGTPGVQHPGDHDGFYEDSSLNGNHLSAWDAAGNPMATDDLPWDDQGGATNAAAVRFAGSPGNIGTWGVGDAHDKDIDSYAFTNGWTIEATFKLDAWGWQVIVGKDGQQGDQGFGEDTMNAPFWIKVRNDNHHLECQALDDSHYGSHGVASIDPLVLGQWYSARGSIEATP